MAAIGDRTGHNAQSKVAANAISVTRARLGDLFSLRRLQRRCFARDQAYGMMTMLGLMMWPRSHVLVARSNGDVIGCIAADIERDQGRILNVCVAPDSRRRGVGAALLNTVEQMLKRNSVTLMVEDKNLGAQALYRRQGYLQVGDVRDYYGRNRHGILMQKRRTPPPVGYRPKLITTSTKDDAEEE